MADVVQHVRESGFPFRDEITHLFVGGSELHGGKVHGTDDLDIYGVYIEPLDMVLGLESFPHFVWSTAGDDRRNRPNDVDVTLLLAQEMGWTDLQGKSYGTALPFCRKLCSQCDLDGNRARPDRFSRANICEAVRGIRRRPTQTHDWQQGAGEERATPEIEEKYGYDLKAAMHTLRLLDLNETFSFAYALGNIRWTKSSRWRRRCLENARNRPSPRFCPIGLIERQYRAF
jgi:uncharacterized protein